MISVVIPAHNEEKYIGKCLSAVKSAAKYVPDSVEMIVVANRCTDKTAAIAERFGAQIRRVRRLVPDKEPLPHQAHLHGQGQAGG